MVSSRQPSTEKSVPVALGQSTGLENARSDSYSKASDSLSLGPSRYAGLTLFAAVAATAPCAWLGRGHEAELNFEAARDSGCFSAREESTEIPVMDVDFVELQARAVGLWLIRGEPKV